MLLAAYQNFSSVSPGDWDSSSSLKIINEMNEFRSDEKRPEKLAAPQSGSDLRSVSNDWMQRQGSILLNGYDKELESAMNEKLNSWFQDPESSAEQTSEANAGDQANYLTSPSQKNKQNLRFARINSLKYDFDEKLCLNLTADPGNTRLDLSQTFNSRTRIGVEHRTANSQTQMFLKYEW